MRIELIAVVLTLPPLPPRRSRRPLPRPPPPRRARPRRRTRRPIPLIRAPRPRPLPPRPKGLFPKSIAIPGTDASFTIGGYAKVDVIHDFDAIGNAYDFQTSSIPVAGSAAADLDGRTTIHARETRFNLDVRAAKRFRAFFEGDFYGDKNAFRLRHAYGEYGRLLGGQTWSTFQDISARPLTVDFEGPDAEVFVRQALVRWTQPLSKKVQWALAVEDPSPNVSVPAGESGAAQSDLPDFVTNLRFTGGRGHAQLGAVLRQLEFKGQGGSPDASATGWGGHLSFAVRPFGKDEIQGQVVYGEGIARYVESLSGQGSDAAWTGTGELEALPVTAIVLGFTHHWSRTLRSGVSWSLADLDNAEAQAASVVKSTQDFRVNLIYTPYALFDVASEVLWGRRENKDGSSGEAWRGQLALIFRFN